MFANESGFFLCSFKFHYLLVWYGAAKINHTRKVASITVVRVADHFRINHSIIARLMQLFRQTGNVTDSPRAGRPRKTTPREDRQWPFSTAGALCRNLALGGHISTHTNQTPPPSGNASATTHKTSSWHYVIAMLDLTGHTIIWGGLFAHGDGSTGLMKVLFCHALLTVVQGFGANDNHALADRPMLMYDNARPHRARIVKHFSQQEAVQTIPWLAMSPDMNPIEHVWDIIGRKINQRNPKCQNIDELRTAILQEWQQFLTRTA